MEGKQRLLQLLAFTTGPAIDVVQQYFEFKIIRQGMDFEDYLNDPQNKHKLFHERYPKIPCCECLRTTSIAAHSKRGCLGYQQFSKLYDENGTVTAGHEQINRSKISQHCICKVSAQKSIKVIDIDLTLLNAIIQHCCNLHITKKIDQWMKDIKEVRNTVSHWSAGQLEKNMFDQTWKKLEKATLQCAGDIGHTSVKIFQMTIDSITTFSVDQLEKRILQTTDTLSKVHKDLNGIIPTVKSVLSKQNELDDQLCSQSKELTEVKNLVSGVNSVVVQTKDVMEKVNIKTEESTNDVAKCKEDLGDLKHMVKQICLKIGMKFQRREEINEDTAPGKRKRSVTLDVEATSTDWDEEKTTLSLKDEMQAKTKRVDNDQHDDTEEFIIEKVENKCIHLELSASPDVFGSPQKLRIAIKSLIDQFVKAAELDENVPATVNMNITVKSALTTEEKKVAFTVFSDNDTLDGSDYNEKLQIEQKPRLLVKPQTFEPDQQMASTSVSEILYSRNKVISLPGVAVKREIQEMAIELISVNLENIKFNLEIKGLPHSLSNSMDKEPGMTIEESIDFSVIWTWHYTQKEHSWDGVSILDTINSRKPHLSDWFRVEDAKIDTFGRLALLTTTASHTFCSLSSLETAVKSFLGKFIEVCEFKKYLKEEQMIKLDVTSQINEYNVEDDNAKIITDECENSVDTILTCDDCKKDLICLVCKTNKSLISRLNDILQKQRNTIMRLQRRMSTFGEWNEGFDGDVCLSDDETEDLDFDDSVSKKRKIITETSPDPQEKAKALKMSTETETVKDSTDTESVKELQEYVIDKEKALQKLGEIPIIDLKIKQEREKCKVNKFEDNPLYRNFGMPPGYSGLSLLMPPSGGLSSTLTGPFQPKRLSTGGMHPSQMLHSLRDRDKIPSAAAQKKPGKWNAVHVRIAWAINQHQQKPIWLQKELEGTSMEPLRPPSHLLPGASLHRPTDLSSSTGLLSQGSHGRNSLEQPPGYRGFFNPMHSGASPFPKPSPYLMSNPLGFGGMASSGAFSGRGEMPNVPGLTSPHEWNRLHRTPPTFPGAQAGPWSKRKDGEIDHGDREPEAGALALDRRREKDKER